MHRIIVGALWLGAAFFFHRYPASRKIFAYLGCIVALVDFFGMAGGALSKWIIGETSVEGGVNLAGFLVGCLLGLVLGIVFGPFASRNDAAYWTVQIISVGFMVFYPLFPW